MYRYIIKGVVQGVGFRPYIYRIAKESGLVGSVKNSGSGVEVVVNDGDFISRLINLPPLAKIIDHKKTKIALKKPKDFIILKSATSKGETELPADIFMCDDCLKELKDKTNRRYNYYFVTCTNCGPRFSMIEDYPYDRPLTSMKVFDMCPECKREYTDPLDRRYHAQTIACPNCGPRLKLMDRKKDISEETDMATVRAAIKIIKRGNSVAIKGVGGFHICSLTDKKSVEKVRKKLGRKDKPFAVMVKNLEMASRFAYATRKEKELLSSPQRPIVVLKKKTAALDAVSELDSIGVMLPYTSLHFLMFDHVNTPFLMTSCNISGEPVATEEILDRFFLTHERKIINRCDDSVLKVIGDKTFYLRRSRGFAPLSIKLPVRCKDTLALGAELNNVICAVKGNRCFMSQYIGDTSKLETFNFLKQVVDDLIRLTRLKPKIIACDMHPQYNSTILAKKLAKKYKARLVQVQHHRAHVAAVAAEHGLGSYTGIAIDGLGYGDDGNIWGGEIFDAKRNSINRIGHLEEQPQLGGDSATIFPKKMLFGILARFMSEKELIRLRLFDKKEAGVLFGMLEHGFNTPMTSSTGRVLDAVSALLGYCDKRTYDGRPAMLLESSAKRPFELKPVIKEKDGKKILMTTPLFRYLMNNIQKDRKRLAATAQMYIAHGLLNIADKKKPIVLSGGAAYNSMITGYLLSKGVLPHKDIPSGDGGICYGQSYLANL